MKTESRIVRVGCALLAWLAVAGTAPLAAGAQSGPLLSGYGAPGQGNQVILGSALLGGPSGGGSSGSGGARQSTGPGRPSFAGGSGTAAAIGRTTSPAHAGKGALARGAGRSGAAPGGTAQASYPVVEPAAASSPALGLSGSDVLYIVLAGVVLALTGLLTRRIARAGPAPGDR